MNAVDILKSQNAMTNMVVHAYLGDLSDTDLLERPGEGCQRIAWQLGHLINSNAMLLEAAGVTDGPQLPDGFAEHYSKEAAASDDTSKFLTKDEYLALLSEGNSAFLAALEKMTPEDLDLPSPESFQSFAPTVGGILGLVATHALMHSGQWVPIRRRLEKPIVI